MNRVAKNSVASIAEVLISAFVMFVLYRAVLETLGAERLGILSIVIATASTSRIGEMGLSAGVTRFVAKCRAAGDHEAACTVLQTAMFSCTVLLTLLLVIAYPLLRMLFEYVFQREPLSEALDLLPYVMLSLILTTVAGVFQSGLAGCQRYELRALLMVVGQTVFLGCALLLMPKYGIHGLALAQIGQGALLVVLGWMVIRREMTELPRLPNRWSWSSFKELIAYGAQLQIVQIAVMIFDPLTKALLGKFGGLDAAAYYQMASQIVSKARSLVSSANQVVIPIAAGSESRDHSHFAELYRSNVRIVLYLVFPLYGVLVAYAPIISEIWIGRYEPQFFLFCTLLALAYLVRTIADPAYFLNLGSGRIIWIVYGYWAMVVTNGVLGILLGKLYGSEGVVCAMTIALTLGSIVIVIGFHSEKNISLWLLLPIDCVWLASSSIASVIVNYYIFHTATIASIYARVAICALMPLIIILPALWYHPIGWGILKGRYRGNAHDPVSGQAGTLAQ